MTTRKPVQRPTRRRSVEETYAALDDLYKLVPVLECRGKCQEACGPIDMSTAEHRRIVNLGIIIPRATQAKRVSDLAMTCPALTMLGTCRVYNVRPMICRLWGAIQSMACPHGCRPEGGFLPEQMSRALLILAGAIGEGQAMTVDEALAAAEPFVREGRR